MSTTATNNDARALRDLIDDLCAQLERSGANETGLPPVYAAMETRHKRSQADELIGGLVWAANQRADQDQAMIDRLNDRISDLEGAIDEAQTALTSVTVAVSPPTPITTSGKEPVPA